jgi:hypothetical protein
MSKKRKTTIVFAAVLLICALLAPRASADYTQFYGLLDADGQEAFVNADNVTSLVSAADLNLTEGWYIVDSDVTVDNSVAAEGSVYLILADGCTLTVGKDFIVKKAGNDVEGFLNVYCQSGGTGALSVGNITVENGYLYIHGGVISASGTIAAATGSVSIRWSTPQNSVTAAVYGDSVALEDTFAADGTNVPASTSNLSDLGGLKLIPALVVTFGKGDGTGTMSDVAVPASSPSYTLPESAFTPPENMMFDHWEQLEDAVSTPVSSPLTLTKQNTTLVAKYKAIPDFKVTFDPGDGSGTMNDVSVSHSSPSYTLPECIFTPPAYMEFDHWEELDGAVSTPVSSPFTLTKSTTTFVAKYKAVEAPPQPEQVSWLLENGVLTISGKGSMEDYAKRSAPWFSRRAEITSVVIGPDVDHIGAYAFYACGAIESVSIQGSGVSVGDRAFSYCCAVSAVTLGDNASISAIGEGAFYACFSLTDRGFAGSATVGSKAFELCGLGG